MVEVTVLPRVTPEEVGVSSAAIIQFIRTLNDRKIPIHSFMMLREGKVLAEAWWKPYAPDDRQMMFSVSKTLTATAIGLAQEEGLLNIDDEVLAYFPSYAGVWARKNAAGVRIRDLLSMSTGHAVDTMEIMRAQPEADWVKVFFEVPFEYPPGTHFLYNSGASFVLAALITYRTGLSPSQYLNSRLFEPVGIDNPPWESNMRGINYGASGLRLTTEEMAILGQLFLQQGEWNGRQVLPAVWVNQASSIQVSNGTDPDNDSTQGYGFQMWRGRHNSFRMNGRYEQCSVVLPDQNMVVALTAGVRDGHPILATLWETLLDSVHDGPLPANRSAQAGLIDLTRNLEVKAPEFAAVPPLVERKLIGRQLFLPFNLLGLTSARLDAEGDKLTLTTLAADGTVESVSAGRTQWLAGASELWPFEEMTRVRTQSRAGWVDDHNLIFHSQVVDSPFARIWRFEVTPQGVSLTVRLDNGFWMERDEVWATGL